MKVSNRVEEEINKKIASGKYQTEEDVLLKALQILTEYDESEEKIREAIRIGREQLDRGEGIPGEQVFADIRQRHQDTAKKTIR